jgi:hypothetical protein
MWYNNKLKLYYVIICNLIFCKPDLLLPRVSVRVNANVRDLHSRRPTEHVESSGGRRHPKGHRTRS